MARDHGFLNRMQCRSVCEILDRDDFGSVNLPEQENTGIDRLVSELAAAHPRQNHRARAAITFATAFFGAG